MIFEGKKLNVKSKIPNSDGAYESQMRFFPPPLTMVIFSIIEVVFFVVDIYHTE